MNPKQFLIIGGIVLLVIGVVGFFGIIGPTAADSVFGDSWWFDNGENWAHTILGVLALLLAFTLPAMAQKWVVILLGVIGVLIGVFSIFTPAFLGANLENPADTILHLAVGVWALLAGFMGKGSSAMKTA